MEVYGRASETERFSVDAIWMLLFSLAGVMVLGLSLFGALLDDIGFLAMASVGDDEPDNVDGIVHEIGLDFYAAALLISLIVVTAVLSAGIVERGSSLRNLEN